MGKKTVPKMPDQIYSCWGGGGLINDPGYWFKKKLDEDPYDISYTRTDLTQSLADALEGLYSAVTDIRGIDMNTYAETELTQARAAIANYRKGEST